jgi:hypothetical protein
LVGIVVGDDRRDNAGRFPFHPAAMLLSPALDRTEVLDELVVLQ